MKSITKVRLSFRRAVQPGDCLDGFYAAAEFFINVHDAEPVFIESSLQFVRDDGDAAASFFRMIDLISYPSEDLPRESFDKTRC